MDELDELLQLWEGLDSDGNFPARPGAARRAEYVREMESLNDAAYEFYKLRQCESAIPLWRRAYETAVRAGDAERQVEYKYWEGHCLRRTGRLREGLACLLELERLHANPPEHWSGLIDQIQTAILIPISLRNIETLIRRCGEEMERLGLQSSRSMLLAEETLLAFYRHDFPTELAKAQEAVSVYDSGAYPKYNIYVHYHDLIDAFLDMKDRPNAERWLEQCEGATTQHEVGKELDILNFRRRLALLDGDHRAAWDYARRHLQKSREAEAHPYDSLRNYAETAIECGYLTEARRALLELLPRYRNAENGHQRYELRRLTGDCHRALARRAAAHRDEAGRQTATSRKYEREARRHTVLARRYYGYAMKVGRFIDERLCCDWHEKEIQERLASLDE